MVVINYALRKTCRNVKKLFLRARLNAALTTHITEKGEVKRLVISYGSQLREADIAYFPTPMCNEILEECPNVLCSWPCSSKEGAGGLDKFMLLAPRIHEMKWSERKFRQLHSNANSEQFEAAFSLMVNLKGCQVDLFDNSSLLT